MAGFLTPLALKNRELKYSWQRWPLRPNQPEWNFFNIIFMDVILKK
jgi:hypothetical protein